MANGRDYSEMFGFKNSNNTEIYTHIAKTGLNKTLGSLDNLNIETEEKRNKIKYACNIIECVQTLGEIVHHQEDNHD